MKYLLSNGLRTSDINAYLKDVLFLNLKTQPNDVPFNTTLGVHRVQDRDSLLELEDKTRELISDLLQRLSTRHSVILTLNTLEVSNTSIEVTVNINNKESGSYSIDVLN